MGFFAAKFWLMLYNVFMKRVLKTIILVLVFSIIPLIFKSLTYAQVQSTNFSGSSKESYQCFKPDGTPSEVSDVRSSGNTGYWLCVCNDGSDPAINGICNFNQDTKCEKTEKPGDPGCNAQQAVIIPPTLQQLEIWFVRILYVIWSVVGALSFFYIVVLGYRYMITRGDVTKVTEIRQKIIYYIIGLVLVFLAVPILTTVFRVLGINRQVDCYNVQMPGFQFFFTDLCTAPKSASDPCSINVGDACSNFGETAQCNDFSPPAIFQCQSGAWNRIN